FLAAHEAQTLEAVFPSTTAAVLTSMATGTYPGQHGVPGWFTHFAELGCTAETLGFIERFSRRPMIELGARIDEAFAEPSLMPRFRHRPLVVTRDYIAGSLYSTWWAGGCPSVAYTSFEDGVDRVLARVAAATEPTYTYLYLNQLDGICHKHGIDDAQTNATFAAIDREMARLHAGLHGSARFIATADHGHVNGADDCVLAHDHPLIAELLAPPSAEARTPVFHVRPGRHDEFRARFADELGEWFAALSIDEVEELGLLGPGPLSARARRRFGDYVGVSAQPHTVTYVPAGGSAHRNRGVHAGLTPDEMLVPLILA
ncbi:MAG: alkaline phosphatase family protein, partial [Planctomycetes bacterium]|nr:alkaline phosphatase family protein [Planctomycetota bacterium]